MVFLAPLTSLPESQRSYRLIQYRGRAWWVFPSVWTLQNQVRMSIFVFFQVEINLNKERKNSFVSITPFLSKMSDRPSNSKDTRCLCSAGVCWTLRTSSATCRQSRCPAKSAIGWRVPSAGRWAWPSVGLRRSQDSGPSSTQCKLGSL